MSIYKWPYAIFLLGVILYTIWSFTQVEPNLVLSNREWLWQLQQKAWEIGFNNRRLSTSLFVVILSLLSLGYTGILLRLNKKRETYIHAWRWWLVAVVILLFSYPALSHDIFNYAFNAKMVWKYKASPHVQVAQEFAADPWLAYMHNIHTPAPYAYGWTIISLIPSVIAGEQIKTAIVVFRFFIIGWLLVTIYSWLKVTKSNQIWIIAVALHPLILIETVSSIHNDIVMMGLVALAIVAGVNAKKTGKKRWVFLSLLLYFGSVSIKYATITLVGVMVLYLLRNRIPVIRRVSWGAWATLAMIVPLLLPQGKYFLPWYAVWPLTLIPLIKEQILRLMVILLGLTALLSYIPFLYLGEYSPLVLQLRTLIIFIPVLSFLVTHLWFWWVGNKEYVHS